MATDTDHESTRAPKRTRTRPEPVVAPPPGVASPYITTSPTVTHLYGALGQFAALGIEFIAESTNPHFKSAYATLPFVLHRVSKPLASVGLVIVQGGALVDGQFSVVTRLCHSSGEWLETVMPIPPSPKALQRDANHAYASANTYGRRLSILGLCGLSPVDPRERGLLEVDDDGNQAANRPTPEVRDEGPRQPPPVATGTTVAGKLYVSGYQAVTGETAGKPWTRYAIEFSDGKKVSTFDDQIGDRADHAYQNQIPVSIETAPAKNPKFTDLLDLSFDGSTE